MINGIRSSCSIQRSGTSNKIIRLFIRKFLNDWSLDFSAMLAYNLLIALLPTVVALFGTFGLILRNYPEYTTKTQK